MIKFTIVKIKYCHSDNFCKTSRAVTIWLNLCVSFGGGNFFGSRATVDVKVARRQRKNNPYSSSIKKGKITQR